MYVNIHKTPFDLIQYVHINKIKKQFKIKTGLVIYEAIRVIYI